MTELFPLKVYPVRLSAASNESVLNPSGHMASKWRRTDVDGTE